MLRDFASSSPLLLRFPWKTTAGLFARHRDTREQTRICELTMVIVRDVVFIRFVLVIKLNEKREKYDRVQFDLH